MKRACSSRSSSSSSQSSSPSLEQQCRRAAASRLTQENPERDEPSLPQPNTVVRRDLSPSMQRLLLEHGHGVISEIDLQHRDIFHARDLAYGWETHELIAFPNSQTWLHLHRCTLDHVERATSSRARLAHVASTLVPKQARPPQLLVQSTGSTASIGTSARSPAGNCGGKAVEDDESRPFPPRGPSSFRAHDGQCRAFHAGPTGDHLSTCNGA